MIWYRVCGLMEGIVHCLFLCTALTSPFPVGATWSFHRITDLLMPQPGDSNESRLSTEDAFLELLTDTLDSMERPARGQFLEKFFKSIAHVDLNETRSLDIWDQVLARKRELSEQSGKKVALQTALVDVLSSASLLRLPILMEYEELRKLQINAATDPLTGLYNRRFFDDYFEKELNRSHRYSHHLALVVFDLHRFKEVNDRYGHPQGDILLQMAATTLRKSMRTSDYAFRIGGDEFALLLPQSDTEQATAMSRRLRAAYEATIEPLHLGMSLGLDYGLAVYPDDGEQQEVLIRVADERLYQLKNATQTSSPATAVPPKTRPVATPVQQVAPVPGSEPLPSEASKPALERRRWERVSLAGTRANALIGEGVESTARVLDLGYGGVALETAHPEALAESFIAVLHVPILPPVRVNLRRIYMGGMTAGNSRVGCSFVT
jgi:diguanylate cyclase (GGDEF)-like protein